jgi:hypothetical protein
MTFRMRRSGPGLLAALAFAAPAFAGPPYISDDPEPTDYGHYEIYAFASGAVAKGDVNGESRRLTCS